MVHLILQYSVFLSGAGSKEDRDDRLHFDRDCSNQFQSLEGIKEDRDLSPHRILSTN